MTPADLVPLLAVLAVLLVVAVVVLCITLRQKRVEDTDPTLTPAFSATRAVVKRCAPSFRKT